MDNSQLKSYVDQSLAQGMKPEEVRAALASQGWTAADIDQALSAPADGAMSMPATPHRKWPVIVGVIVVALVLGAGAAFAYLKIFAASPDKILAKAVNGAMAAESMEYAGSLRVEMTVDPEKEKGAVASQTLSMLVPNESGEPTKLLLSFNGAFDRHDAANPKSRGGYTLATTQAFQGAPIGTLETRTTGGTTYLSLTKVPEVPLFDLSPLAGVWVNFDMKALGSMFGASATSTPPKAPKEGPTAAQRAEIEKAFIEIRPVYVSETLKDEEVEGTVSRHYRMAVDKEKLRAFSLKVQEILGDKESLAYEKFADEYDKFSKDVEVTTLEIWIGKKGGMPTRLLMEARAKQSEDVPADGTFTLDATFKNFGQPVQIEAPADAKTIPEAMELMMGVAAASPVGSKFVAEGATQSDDARRITDVRQIQTALELAFSETNGYPYFPNEIVLGGGTLCDVDGASRWTTQSRCTGSVYMKDVPGEPTSFGGVIGGYRYTGVPGWYLLGFEIIIGAGSYTPGPHCATPNGIEAKGCDTLDTDNDGFKDLQEIAGGYDPNGEGRLPPPPEPDPRRDSANEFLPSDL